MIVLGKMTGVEQPEKSSTSTPELFFLRKTSNSKLDLGECFLDVSFGLLICSTDSKFPDSVIVGNHRDAWLVYISV